LSLDDVGRYEVAAEVPSLHHESLAIDLRRSYDLRLVCDHCSPQLLVFRCCSPHRGSDMSAQGNALGTGAV